MNTRSISPFLRFAMGLVWACSLALGDVVPAHAAVRCYVKADANGNGSSWANAFRDLQSALGASPCTEVWVARGTYVPTSGADQTKYFLLKSGVALYGGFAGTETLLGQRNPIANPTILSGDIGATGNSDNSYHVVLGSLTDSTARLDGFTITAGNADGAGSYSYDSGGGMYSNQGSPTLVNLTFSGNSATYGGGMYNYNNSNPSLTNVTFSGNSAFSGGGMYNYQSSPSLTNMTFSGNSASLGGGMYNYQSSPSLMNVTFSVNSATSGAGMYNDTSSSPIIGNSILYGDTGPEISNNSSTATISFSIVQGGYPGTGNLDANPLLGPLGNNGGFTKTRVLGFGSPAIDAGTNTGCPAKDQRGRARPQDGDGNGIATCDMGATEASLLTKSFRSAGAQDGWILESTETSGAGGSMDSTQATFALGDDDADRQGLSILSFNTGSLPDTAVIASVILKIKKAGVVGTNPFRTHGNILVDIRRGAFNNNAALQLQDFQATANKKGALVITNNPVDGWYSRTMGSTNFIYINKRGVTQFRLKFAKDDNDDMGLDYIKFYSGNSTTANRPQLIIQYYTP